MGIFIVSRFLGRTSSENSLGGWDLLRILARGQREFSIPGILDESQLHFFSLDHEKSFSEVSISSRNLRVTKWNLVLVSKYENNHMIISISSRKIAPSLESESEILNPNQLQCCTEGNHMIRFLINKIMNTAPVIKQSDWYLVVLGQ